VSYIERSLAENEVLQYRARFHWLYHAAAWGALIIGAVVAMMTLDADVIWIAAVALLVGIAIWLAILVPIWTTEIGVTNQRVIYKRGLVQRNTSELQLRSIEEVRFIQDVWGRLLNYGKLEIHGTGDDAIYLPAVADPIGLRAALQGAVGNAQGDPQPLNSTQHPTIEGEQIRAGQA
jgi:uncharacterized membrane protein YdbT with pleckstrin-like domain